MRRYLWGFWQVMSAVAHQGTLSASHCRCNVNSFYSCDCVGNCFWGASVTLQHTNTRQDPESRVIGPSQRPLPDITRHSQETTMSPARFEPAISVSERPQTYNLDPRPPGSANTVYVDMKARDDCNFKVSSHCNAPVCSVLLLRYSSIWY